MTTYTVMQLDPAPEYDPIVAERLEAIYSFLANFPIGNGDRLAFQAPRTRENPTLENEIEQLVPTADFLLAMRTPVTRQIIRMGKRLRLIHKLGIDLTNVDTVAATEAGIPIALTPHYGLIAVAEHTLMLMLALSRKLVQMHQLTKAAENPQKVHPVYTTQWQRHFNWMGLAGGEFSTLMGKTLGIVGLGEIGKAVVQRARGFDMKILYTKRHRLSPVLERALDVTFVPLDQLMQMSDYVSLHITHHPGSDNMIGEKQLGQMKQTSFLINTARGNVIDQQALIQALRQKRIAGAGLDVYSVEPIESNNPLLQLDNVVLTPHIAAHGEPILRYVRAFDNCKRVVEGLPPQNLVEQTHDVILT